MRVKPWFRSAAAVPAVLLLVGAAQAAMAETTAAAKTAAAGDPSGTSASGVGSDGSSGQLNIEGTFIERLIFKDANGQKREVHRPGPSVSLPAGRYRLERVDLVGNVCHTGGFAADDWLQLTPGKPCRLKVGAPLTRSVTARRNGRLVQLDYELVDGAGRAYSASDDAGQRAAPPQFTVYGADGRKIGAGSFEYG